MQRLQYGVVERRPDAASAPSSLVGFPDLSDNLVFADDERFEAAGDPHQVPEALLVAQLAGRPRVDADEVVVERLAGGFGLVGDDIGLRAIAGLEDERLRDTGTLQKRLDGLAFGSLAGGFDLLDARVAV